MVFLNWDSLPWFWHGFDMFWFALLMVMLAPACWPSFWLLVCFSLARYRSLSFDHHPGIDLRVDARVFSATKWASAATMA